MRGRGWVRATCFVVGLVACEASPEEERVGQAQQAVDACRAIVLDASVSYAPKIHGDAVVDVAPPLGFLLPSEIPIVQGNGAKKRAYLSFTNAGQTTTCAYRSHGVAHPKTPAQLAQADRYVFESCTHGERDDDDRDDLDHDGHEQDDGHSHPSSGTSPGSVWTPLAVAGDLVVAEHLELTIDGDNKGGTTRAIVELHEEAPCAGQGGSGGQGGVSGQGGFAQGGGGGLGQGGLGGVAGAGGQAQGGQSASVGSGPSTTSSVATGSGSSAAATRGAGGGFGSTTSSGSTTASVGSSGGFGAGGANASSGAGGASTTSGGPDLCVGIDADDQNPCTLDACDPSTGDVSHTADVGATCADPDSDACNGGGVCDASGVCQPGAPPAIDDGDPATIDSCENGAVVHRPVPPLDATGVTTAADAWAFLYSGPDPIQTGVAPGTIDFVRAAMVQGDVRLPSGDGAMGATVTILGHPELGVTHTDFQGHFMMAVNGGGGLTLDVQMPGYLRVQRQAEPAWQEAAKTHDIVLTASDSNVTFIDLAGLTEVVHAEGSVTIDDRAPRQGTLLISPGTAAELQFADGTTSPISQLDVRITEFTVGADGPSRMPADLPASSAYTYAFEMNADQAIAAGAEHVLFSKPMLYFVDNFIGVDVGTVVPVGTYDRARGHWAAEDNGVVIAILDTSTGFADIDTDGDGIADDAGVLEALGLDLPAREHLAT